MNSPLFTLCCSDKLFYLFKWSFRTSGLLTVKSMRRCYDGIKTSLKEDFGYFESMAYAVGRRNLSGFQVIRSPVSFSFYQLIVL